MVAAGLQKSVVLLSRVPCAALLTAAAPIIGAAFFDVGADALRAAMQDVARWYGRRVLAAPALAALASHRVVALCVLIPGRYRRCSMPHHLHRPQALPRVPRYSVPVLTRLQASCCHCSAKSCVWHAHRATSLRRCMRHVLRLLLLLLVRQDRLRLVLELELGLRPELELGPRLELELGLEWAWMRVLVAPV